LTTSISNSTSSPFLKRSADWKNTKYVELVDYGGGIKHSKKYGTIYATNGHKVLAIEMKGGYKFVIGTQNKSELEAFLEKSEQLYYS